MYTLDSFDNYGKPETIAVGRRNADAGDLSGMGKGGGPYYNNTIAVRGRRKALL